VNSPFRSLPTLGEILESPPLRGLVDRVQRHALVSRAREVLEELRSQLQSATSQVPIPNPSELAQRVADWFYAAQPAASLAAINATGTLLDPRLGLPPLADAALEAVHALGRSWTALNAASPLRPEDFPPPHDPFPALYTQAQQRLARLTHAEAALLIHHPAAAQWLLLVALAGHRPVAAARSSLVELPGQVPLTAIAPTARTPLLEVGSANCVRLEDYENVLQQQPAAIFYVENWLYKQTGWATSVGLEDVRDVARRHGVPLWVELGGAALADLTRFGIEGVPQVGAVVASGADLVLVAGHGWMGGPPCGLIVGRATLIEALRSHPLYCVARASPLTVAAMDATLRLYEEPGQAELAIPLLALAAAPQENLRQRAERLAPQMAVAGKVEVSVVADQSDVSGTGLPGHQLPTWCLAVTSNGQSAEDIQARLLKATPRIIGKQKNGFLLLDLRSVLPREDVDLVNAFRSVWLEKTSDEERTG
jgi:L-seryl-tRNA(Ser) seleniumtransferase